MPEQIHPSTAKQLIDSLGNGMPHDEQVLEALRRYLGDRAYFQMSDETAAMIQAALDRFAR